MSCPHAVTVSIFRGKSPRVAAEDTGTWDDFIESLTAALDAERTEKIDLPAITCCAFADKYRNDANVGAHTALLIDVDAVPDLDALLERCSAYTCLVYESPSSRKDAPRLRIIAALAEPYPAHAVSAARSAFARDLGLDPRASGVSKAAAASQIYFVGRITGSRRRKHWAYAGKLWTPPAPGTAPELESAAQGEPSEPAYSAEKIPDLSALAMAIEPPSLGDHYQGGRDVSRAIGGWLARKGYHPDAIAQAVTDQIPSRQPDERADQARETAEQWYSGDARAAGYQTLQALYGDEVMAEVEHAVSDPWVERLIAAWPPERPPAPFIGVLGSAPPSSTALEALPVWVRAHVESVREELRTPIDLNLANALGALSSAVQGHVRVRIHRNYACHTCLLVCSVADSSQRKSPAFRNATAPIKVWEQERQVAETETLAEARAERSALEVQLKAAQKVQNGFLSRAERPHSDDMLDVVQLQIALDAPAPVAFEYLVEDATPEALADLLAVHGRLACFSSDAAKVFRIAAGKYSGGEADLGVWLEAYDGNSRKVHRIGRKVEAPRHEQTTLSAVLSIQPQVLESITGNASLVGEGLLPRFAWVLCEASGVRISGVEDRPEPVPEAVAAAYAARLRAMLAIPSGTEVGLSAGADAAYRQWELELEHRMHGDGADLSGDMLAWAGKHLERTVRIAGILWAADGAEGKTISAEQMARAIAIGRWLIPHAVRALRGDEFDDLETKLLGIAARLAEASGSCSRRDIQRNAPRALRGDSKALLARLDNLVDRGQLKLVGKAQYSISEEWASYEAGRAKRQREQCGVPSLLDVVRRSAKDGRATLREIQRRAPTGLQRREALEKALAALVASGELTEKLDGAMRFGRRLPTYSIAE